MENLEVFSSNLNVLQKEKNGDKKDEPPPYEADFESKDWLTIHKNSIKDIEELSQYLPLKDEEKHLLKKVSRIYHLRIPLYYLSLIKDSANAYDPIRKQCVPSYEEIAFNGFQIEDPLGEENTSPVPFLVHRYPDRVLLIVTSRCFMYCRHCTRKRLWKRKNTEPALEDIKKAVLYIKENPKIREVIISGGDPLTLSNEKIDYILSIVYNCKNIEAIRIGTRAPVVLPQRIDDDLCDVLEKYDNLWINTQFNHPDEITPQSTLACKKLQKCGIPISNQSVLLKGINDSAEIFIKLCQKLQSIRVKPYYLFQCDPTEGVSHFRASVFKGMEIMDKMRGYTGGMCIPAFVVDGIDGKGKIPISSNYLLSISKDGLLLRNYRNEVFFYPTP